MSPARLEIIDDARTSSTNAIPLVLIHDGGGTIFQYCMLEQPLGRRTYGISNPYFGCETGPPGGIPELAKQYVQAMRQTLRRGRVILGGWSLGGMISLEMARILSNDRSFDVVGLLWMDTICPWSTLCRIAALARPCYLATTKPEMKSKVDACFDDAWRMMQLWDCPAPHQVPPVVLIRAKQTIWGIDRLLGWGKCEFVSFVDVLDAEGNHFSMFDASRVRTATRLPADYVTS